MDVKALRDETEDGSRVVVEENKFESVESVSRLEVTRGDDNCSELSKVVVLDSTRLESDELL